MSASPSRAGRRGADFTASELEDGAMLIDVAISDYFYPMMILPCMLAIARREDSSEAVKEGSLN